MSESLGVKYYTENTAQIVSAYIKNNPVSVSDLPEIITTVQASLRDVTKGESAPDNPAPIVSVRRSVRKDHIVCLACGQKKKMLKRHLRVVHELSPDAYKALFELKPDYPLVAPSYAEVRSSLAKKIGLGRKRGQHRSRRK